MSRKGRRGEAQAPASWEGERTMAAAEEDQREQQAGSAASTEAPSRCACGSDSMLLQAFVQVVDGRPQPGFVETETLTCPECNREYEPIQTDDGRILRGDFLGMFDESD